jgi:hypothetical protein
MYVPVSLRPVSKEWYGSIKHNELVSAVQHGKAGNWAKRLFKTSNLEEYAWRSTQKNLPLSSLQNAIQTDSFDTQDKLIFGLARSV